MRILLLTHAFNSLTQRLFVDLRHEGHEVTVEFDINDAVTREAVALARPDVVVAPFLKRRIPDDVLTAVRCLVVHPGPPGDRGPAALDWAVLEGREEWGVTVLEATAELDGGPVWAHEIFPVRAATKASLYRREITEAAVCAVLRALERVANGALPQDPPSGGWRGPCRQTDRAIDWAADDTETVLRKIRSADGHPGLKDRLFGEDAWLFDATPAEGLSGPPGTEVARAGWAVAKATRDGAVWIGQARRAAPPADGPPSIKLPTARAFPLEAIALPEVPGPSDVQYQEMGDVGILRFPFYNGAMAAEQCEILRQAYGAATARPTKVIVLLGGPDFWSNGIHLNTIEAAASPAEESWRTINAMDDLTEAIIRTTSHVTVAALEGNAGAGGVFLALAADHVWARHGVVLNPHYKNMGNLYGSEFWTYLLPRRAGEEGVAKVMAARLPIGAEEACDWGLVERVLSPDHGAFVATVLAGAEALAADPTLDLILEEKAATRAEDEAEKPLSAYRAEELERMKLNFFGFDSSYHVARYDFVTKRPKSHTPLHLARHRRKSGKPTG